jgi:hypothetical protein
MKARRDALRSEQPTWSPYRDLGKWSDSRSLGTAMAGYRHSHTSRSYGVGSNCLD